MQGTVSKLQQKSENEIISQGSGIIKKEGWELDSYLIENFIPFFVLLRKVVLVFPRHSEYSDNINKHSTCSHT